MFTSERNQARWETRALVTNDNGDNNDGGDGHARFQTYYNHLLSSNILLSTLSERCYSSDGLALASDLL